MFLLGQEAQLSCKSRASVKSGLQGPLAYFLLSWVLLEGFSVSLSLFLDVWPSCIGVILFVCRASELCPPGLQLS